MTREEAIAYIKSEDIHEEAEREAFEMAIKALEDIPKYRKEARRWKRKVLLADDKKALQKAYENGFTMGQLVSEQEPCDDAISRKKAICVISACDGKSAQIEALEQLPSVTQKLGKK